MDNATIAAALNEAAQLLEAQGANPFRVGAYRRAADEVLRRPDRVEALFESQGIEGLDALPGVGRGIAAAIAELLVTGRWTQLERLRGGVDPIDLLRTIPGVGAQIAHRMYEQLGIDTLEDVEAAAHDGRLARLPGVGTRRAAAIGAAATQRIAWARPSRRAPAPDRQPPVQMLLDVDRTYRLGAQAGSLPKIAPRRFNPGHEAWLPVLHTHIDDWNFTALYSNTARAHDLDRVRDWVLIFCNAHDHAEQRYTVVTETTGALAGRRVVRGRAPECSAWYASAANPPGVQPHAGPPGPADAN